MKKTALIFVLPLMLAACGSSSNVSPEVQQLQTACSGGDIGACQDLGHMVRAAKNGS